MFDSLGQRVLTFFADWGGMTRLSVRTIKSLVPFRKHWHRTAHQMVQLGVDSIGITFVTSLSVGMAFAIQIVNEFLKFGAGSMIGGIMGLAFWRELGPLMIGVVVAGRVGAAITAEIGSMKVTEQVEALESMSQDPVAYLVLPRVLACTIMMPLLVGFADIVGFLGGYGVAIATGRVNGEAYFNSAQGMLIMEDIYFGLIKAAVFGFVIAIISAYYGLNATAGAKGVGIVTTKAVVTSLISVFVLNYFFSLIFF